MKNSLFNISLVGLLFGLSVQPVVAKSGKIHRRLEEFLSLPKALETMSRALESNSGGRLFRVSWSNNAPSSRGHEIVLYDRSRGTLKYYRRANSLVSEEKPIRRITSDSIVYRGVSAQVIQRMLDSEPKDRYGFTTDETLLQLVWLGENKQIIRKKSHQYTAR
ncbi:hypothetical protein EON83_26615 [bacterium]|nr:MAG: hypothetical protein EON83_26615 [bacterium]